MPATVVVTASAGTFPGLADALRQVPLEVRERPLLSFAPPADWSPVDEALDGLSRFDAIALTSPRAARAFGERLVGRFGGSPETGRHAPPVWAGGSGTVAALAGLVPEAHCPPPREVGEKGAAAALAAAMLAAGVRGPVLFPCGENDGRVNPLHSRKMTAALQAATTSDHPILLRMTASAGHGMGSSLRDRVAEQADIYSFLFKELGVDTSPWTFE